MFVCNLNELRKNKINVFTVILNFYYFSSKVFFVLLELKIFRFWRNVEQVHPRQSGILGPFLDSSELDSRGFKEFLLSRLLFWMMVTKWLKTRRSLIIEKRINYNHFVYSSLTGWNWRNWRTPCCIIVFVRRSRTSSKRTFFSFSFWACSFE